LAVCCGSNKGPINGRAIGPPLGRRPYPNAPPRCFTLPTFRSADRAQTKPPGGGRMKAAFCDLRHSQTLQNGRWWPQQRGGHNVLHHSVQRAGVFGVRVIRGRAT
jgi:hypothetical protein